MENKEEKPHEEHLHPHAHKPIEDNYPKHKADPGPSPQAVKEKDINGAAIVLRWIIPLLVIALLIYWLFFK
ncbi:MAG: hypothetical protein P0Y49_08230 [Candidatus Pedobacter colombiensis]|uniref:Uncharacterized protein n=1 Tax=Candidatus Pedobacter colombiensis TaxID=3121371 RepID=A0AAJ5WAP0_9SPHI|nr:hypothetical protein [Pedobacter sp.]WEK21126.1 MAG: hypothetical protein P0Y49_08230 [Pedobacter sp.]